MSGFVYDAYGDNRARPMRLLHQAFGTSTVERFASVDQQLLIIETVILTGSITGTGAVTTAIWIGPEDSENLLFAAEVPATGLPGPQPTQIAFVNLQIPVFSTDDVLVTVTPVGGLPDGTVTWSITGHSVGGFT